MRREREEREERKGNKTKARNGEDGRRKGGQEWGGQKNKGFILLREIPQKTQTRPIYKL